MHTVNVFKNVLPSEVLLPSKITNTCTSCKQSRRVGDLHIPREVCCLGPQDTATSHQQLYTHGEYPLRWLCNQISVAVGFMHTSECPLRWRCNQELSVAISPVLRTQLNVHRNGFRIKRSSAAVSPVLWTQLNVHRDGIAIRYHLLLFHQFYAPKRVSTEMALQSEIICCHLIMFYAHK